MGGGSLYIATLTVSQPGVLSGPSITLDLGKLPRHAWQEKEVGGFLGIGATKVYMSLFTLEMIAESASIRFEVRCGGAFLAEQSVDAGFVGTS